MKKESVKQQNVKLKKKIKSLTIERNLLESELKLCYQSRDISMHRSEDLNDLALDVSKKLKKFKGKGKHLKYDDLISYIEILRRYETDKRDYKPKAKDFIDKFNKDTEKNIKERTFNSFLDKIEKDISVYTEINNSFCNGKTNDEILIFLKTKLHFNVKV